MSVGPAFGPLFRRLGISVLAPAMLLVALPAAIHIVQKPDLGFDVRNLRVVLVRPGEPGGETGVRRGDRILAVDGQPVHHMRDFYRLRALKYDVEPVRLTVLRDGNESTVAVIPRPVPQAQLVFSLSMWLAGLAFLMIGWWVYSKRQDDVARNFFGLCLIFAFYLLNIPDLPNSTYMTVKEILRDLLQLLWPVLFLRFFQLFPAPSVPPPVRRRQRLLYVPAAVLMTLVLAAQAAGLDEDSALVAVLSAAVLAHFVCYFAAGLVVFARKVLRRDRPVLHTKLRIILLGLVGGLVPFLIGILVGSAGAVPSFPHWEYLGFPLLLVPATFALAIMRYGALDTAFVVRVSLTYGLLTLAILAAYFLVVGVLGETIMSAFGVSDSPVAIVAIAGCSLLVLPLRRRLQRVIDLAFYPSRRADREALATLARTLAEQMDADAAYELLLRRLHDLYRPRSITLMLSEGDPPLALRTAGALADGGPVDLALELAFAAPLARFLDRARRPVFREEYEDSRLPAVPDPAGQSLLAATGCVLLVPLISGNRLLGALLLGAKDNNGLYSQTDLANLATLGLQAASLLRSLSLVRESLLRKQLETELGVARDIQAQLLPTATLDDGRFTIAGCMDPCRQIGGDYFDYFPLGDNYLGLCIADVAGKGIPAALLMSSVRAAFRAEATAGRTPEVVVGALNRRVADVLTPTQFVSFFYAILDVDRHELAFTNAGMDPPLLYHADSRRELLRKGGPVLGILPDHPYRRGTVALSPGDLLLAYTDGVTDQTAPVTGEFFDLERLEVLARQGRNLPPRDLCERIFAAVETFGGSEASDDRTVMVLKFSG